MHTTLTIRDRVNGCLCLWVQLGFLTVTPWLLLGGEVVTLHSFSNIDGNTPRNVLLQHSNGLLYGTARRGGAQDAGNVYTVSTNGQFSVLAEFVSTNYGRFPRGGLVLGNDGNFYGTTYQGRFDGLGDGAGTLFRVTPGGELTRLVALASIHGVFPDAPLIQASDGAFYGTAWSGGANWGTVFKYTTNGALTTFVTFHGTNGGSPLARLLEVNGLLYGTTSSGGAHSAGTVFHVSLDGIVTTLWSFDGTNGARPAAGLSLGPDQRLYGTTEEGGASNLGTIFCISTNGVLSTLFSFGGSNGAAPAAELLLAKDGFFYGTTYSGGESNLGTLFRLGTNGIVSTLATFYRTNGARPRAGLTQGMDGHLYGTTYSGGHMNVGTIFQFPLPGPELVTLQAQQSGSNVLVSWPVSAAGYRLQSTVGLSPPNWEDSLGVVSTNGGSHVVTNPISHAVQFFRLRKPGD